MKFNRQNIIIFIVLMLFITMSCRSSKYSDIPVKFDPETLPDAQVGETYEAEIIATENHTPVGEFSMEGTLPPGLELIQDENDSDIAHITGIPEEAGEFTFMIEVWCYGTMANGQTGEKEYTIIVKE